MNESSHTVSIRVLVVDDHLVVREGLKHLLGSVSGFEVVGTAEDGHAAVRLAASLRPDVVLLDLGLPGMSGLDVISEIGLQEGKRPHVLVLTVHEDEGMVLEAITRGASGYVLKQATRAELFSALRKVAEGGRYFDSVVAEALLSARAKAPNTDDYLNAREIQTLDLVAAGCTNREIASRLFVSPDTVKAHLSEVFRKLGARDRTEAVAMAFRRGLVE
jgi:DNA-binding NarL/FixJ family response regulator